MWFHKGMLSLRGGLRWTIPVFCNILSKHFTFTTSLMSIPWMMSKWEFSVTLAWVNDLHLCSLKLNIRGQCSLNCIEPFKCRASLQFYNIITFKNTINKNGFLVPGQSSCCWNSVYVVEVQDIFRKVWIFCYGKNHSNTWHWGWPNTCFKNLT